MTQVMTEARPAEPNVTGDRLSSDELRKIDAYWRPATTSPPA